MHDDPQSRMRFDFLVHQQNYVDSLRVESNKRLSLSLAFLSLLFVIFTSEIGYTYRQHILKSYILVLAILTLINITLVLYFALHLLLPITVDSGSIMVPTAIRSLVENNSFVAKETETVKEPYEIYLKVISETTTTGFLVILAREIYALAIAEGHRRRDIHRIIYGIGVLYCLVIVVSIAIVFTPVPVQ